MIPARIFVLLGLIWASLGLAFRLRAAGCGSRDEYAPRVGSATRAIWYNLTVGLWPGRKESARRHPAEFAAGLLLHVGVLLTLAGVGLLLAWPVLAEGFLPAIRPVLPLSLTAGLALFLRRIFSRTLRAFSTPDDYLAILATCGLLAAGMLAAGAPCWQIVLLLYAGLVAIYFPLGKLRHAVFFFLARAEYGGRLGYRGVYPPQATETECSSDG